MAGQKKEPPQKVTAAPSEGVATAAKGSGFCGYREIIMKSEQLEAFLDSIRDAATDLKIAIADEAEANSQTQDILHAIEMDRCNLRKSATLVKTLSGIRKKRRAAKKTIERLTPVVEWSQGDSTAIKRLEKLLGDLRKIERLQQGRSYSPRSDILESGDLLLKENGQGRS